MKSRFSQFKLSKGNYVETAGREKSLLALHFSQYKLSKNPCLGRSKPGVLESPPLPLSFIPSSPPGPQATEALKVIPFSKISLETYLLNGILWGGRGGVGDFNKPNSPLPPPLLSGQLDHSYH